LNIARNLLSIAVGIGLMLLLIYYLDERGYAAELGVLTAMDHVISFVVLFILFALSGLQLRLALRKSEGVNLSMMDTLALPVTQSFWGHVIPVQGSFVYGATFLKAKYGANVSGTMAVYLFITVCSLVIGALFGIVHSLFYDIRFLPLYLLLAALPLWLVVAYRILSALNPEVGLLLRIKELVGTVLGSTVTMLRAPVFVLQVVLIDVAYVALNSLWSFYLSESLNLHIPIGIFVLVSFFMKLTIVAKFTPGNMGVTQLFTGGVLSAYGYPAEAGLLVSTLQLGLLIAHSFPAAIILSLFQFKHIRTLLWGSSR
jgi:hypothetical protein